MIINDAINGYHILGDEVVDIRRLCETRTLTSELFGQGLMLHDNKSRPNKWRLSNRDTIGSHKKEHTNLHEFINKRKIIVNI